MTDRICIASKGAQNFHISAEDLVCMWFFFFFFKSSYSYSIQHAVIHVVSDVMVVSHNLLGHTTKLPV